MSHYKYFCTWHAILLSFTMNAIAKTSYALLQGSSLFTIAFARAFSPFTLSESGVDINSSSSSRSVLALTLTQKFLDSISTLWPCFRYSKDHAPPACFSTTSWLSFKNTSPESTILLIFRLSVIEIKSAST